MQLSDAKTEQSRVTGLFSNVTRQLLFAGVAIVWLFSTQPNQAARSVEVGALRVPLLILLLGLAFDFIQYAIRGVGVRWYYDKKNKQYRELEDFLAKYDIDYRTRPVDFPDWISDASQVFFYGKGGCVIVAYVWLIQSLLVDLF